MAEVLRGNIGSKFGDFAPAGAGWLKILRWRDRPHQPFFLKN